MRNRFTHTLATLAILFGLMLPASAYPGSVHHIASCGAPSHGISTDSYYQGVLWAHSQEPSVAGPGNPYYYMRTHVYTWGYQNGYWQWLYSHRHSKFCFGSHPG